MHDSDTASDIQYGKVAIRQGDIGPFETIIAFTTLCASWICWWGWTVNDGLLYCTAEKLQAKTRPHTGSHSGLHVHDPGGNMCLITTTRTDKSGACMFNECMNA